MTAERYCIFRRVLGVPDGIPTHPYITQSNLHKNPDSYETGPDVFDCEVDGFLGQKRRYPVDRSAAATIAAGPPVIANIELGPEMHRALRYPESRDGTGDETVDCWNHLMANRAMRGLSHIAAVNAACGGKIRGYYRSIFPPKGSISADTAKIVAERAWRVTGGLPLVTLSAYGQFSVGWLGDLAGSLDVADWLRQRHGVKVGVFLTPVSLDDPGYDAWALTLDVINQVREPLIDELYFFFDGGKDRTEYQVLERFTDRFLM